MCGTKKIFVATFISLLAFVLCEEQLLQAITTETNTVETNQTETAVLDQLKVEESNLGTIYTYKCSVGSQSSNNLVCNTNSTTIWRDASNVDRKVRCGNSESDLLISYVDMIFSVTSAIVNCSVHEGSIGLGYIGLTLNAWNTTLLNYMVSFYTY